MCTTNSRAYTQEPDNYKEFRESIQKLMSSAKQLRSEFSELSEQAIIQEMFQNRSQEIKGQLSQMVYTLGEMYGYTLADDVLENVEL